MSNQTEQQPIEQPDLVVLSVDAWGDNEGGWTWNQWYRAATISQDSLNWSKRKLLSHFRNELCLTSQESKGRIDIEDDGYNVVLAEKKTGRPLYAIEYGSILN